MWLLSEGVHYIVINKPANISSVEKDIHKLSAFKLIEEKVNKNIRAAHRLDKETSGCLVFAKTKYGQQSMVNAFKHKIIKKKYIAITEGEAVFSKKIIKSRPLGKNKKGLSITKIRTLQKGNGMSLIEAIPLTGRMHQIRLHLASEGLPVIGDKKHKSKASLIDGTIALVAYLIEFPKPEGGKRVAIAPLPLFFKKLLGNIGYKKHSNRHIDKNPGYII